MGAEPSPSGFIYEPAHGSTTSLPDHPRLSELPETYRHPRHFWVFNLPEMETQIWLSRFRQSEQIWMAARRREE